MDSPRSQGKRFQYLAREHRKVSLTMLEDELEELRQARLKEADAQKETTFETTNKSGVVMIWREFGQTIALHLGYDENKVKEKDAPLVRAGPPEKMGPRFSKLYKQHFVTKNVENPASCAGDEISEHNIPRDEGVKSKIDICVMSETCDEVYSEKERSRLEQIAGFNTVVVQTEKQMPSTCRPVSSMWKYEQKLAIEPPSVSQPESQVLS
jgi:hypothetical protein